MTVPHTPPEAALSGRRNALRSLGATVLMGSPLTARLALANPAGTPATDQTASGQARRLVVVMLRGALDGLAAVPAPGDPHWQDLRGGAAAAQNNLQGAPPGASGPARPLDGVFAMHPALTTLHSWYEERQLLVLHAVASGYRERSHFDAQQLLESGGARPFELSTGWLGRALRLREHQAVALSPAMPLALRGAGNATTWTPARRASEPDADLLARVATLYRPDPALARAWSQAMTQQGLGRAARAGAAPEPAMGAGMAPGGNAGAPGGQFTQLARQAGMFLATPDGPRVAWLETDGWDTHTQQAGRLARLLTALDEGLAALRLALGPAWSRTTVLVMTEFGRTARFNGAGGTDHGTAAVAFVAGGGVAGGRVWADWPGLAPHNLHEGRDLRPTLDLHAVIATLVQQQFDLDARELAQVLPGASPAAALRQALMS